MRIVGTVMGALVAAVVLIVVAVPILGGLAGSQSVVLPDEANEGEKYYYRSLDSEGWTLTNLHIEYYSTVPEHRLCRYTWTSTDTGETAEYEIDLKRFDNVAIEHKRIILVLADRGGLICGPNNNYTVFRFSEITNTNQYVNSTTDVTFSKAANGNWTMTGTDVYNTTIGQNAIALCPSTIAEFVGGTSMYTMDEATILNIPAPTTNTISTAVIKTLYNEGDLSTTLIKTYTAATYGTPTVHLNVDQYKGYVGLNGLTTELPVTSNSETHILEGNEYIILVPNRPIVLSEVSEYGYLIWLLPVMLAVVLIASVAYQIVPKRRNDE